MATVAILIPAMRPQNLANVVASIEESTPEPHRTIIIATGECAEAVRGLPVELVDDGGGTWPQRINRGYRASNEPFVFTGADDLKFHPGWFEAAMIAMSQFPNGFGVVAVNDCYNRAGVHYLIAKTYVDSLGGVIDGPLGTVVCEAYSHAYVDDEFRATAMYRDRFVRCEDSVVEHMHPGAGKSQMDAVYQLGESTMSEGLATFQSRSHLWQS